ncbi:MAG: NUDIX domain-containing protein [Paracoccaceae bacterium]|nr:NUDIX domain-containing protein [Paracoccaceae bacterium]
MSPKPVRLAARAVIIHESKLLLVNAWPKARSTLLCAPGGGVEPGASLPDNLAREVKEETGLHVKARQPCLVNEFHDPRTGFHQVEVFFRCDILGDHRIPNDWQDPEQIVNRHIWASEEEVAKLNFKPSSLAKVAFSDSGGITYDLLETIVM